MATAQRTAAQQPTAESSPAPEEEAATDMVSEGAPAPTEAKTKRDYHRPTKTVLTLILQAHESVNRVPDVAGYVKAAMEKAGGVVTVLKQDAGVVKLRLDTAESHRSWKSPRVKVTKAQQDQIKAAVAAKAAQSGRSVDDVLAELLGGASSE
jgi:hypothetical protein